MLKRNSQCSIQCSIQCSVQRLGYGLILTTLGGLGTLSIAPLGNAQPIGLTDIDLVCYMQTADGRTVDLTTICGRQRPQTETAPAATLSRASLSPYTNLGGLDIYGRGANAPPCFGLDDQGNRCPSSDSSSGNSTL